MTNPIPKKISELPTLGGISDGDLIPVVDISDTSFNTSGETKKVSYSVFKATIQQEIDTEFVEEDPVFAASVAGSITTTNTAQWNAAYGWGNHAAQGYLQSISAQSIDVLNDVDTSTATPDDILKWNGNSWVAAAESQGTTINGLNDVGDVDISSVANDQVLRYDSSTQKWKNQTIAAGIGLSSFSVSENAASSSPSLSYNNANGVFTYTPPDLSSLSSDVIDDLTPELGGNLGLNSKTINGSGTIDITGDVKSSTLRLSNNATTPSSGNTREIKVIGNAPHFYDGTDWRPFFLIDNSATILQADTDWGNVMIRATFDSDFNDVKYNVTPTRSSTTSTALVSSPVKVGVKALRLDDAYISWDTTDTSKYEFTGAWTMEAWVYIDEITGFDDPDCIFSGGGSSTNQNWALLIEKFVDGTMDFRWYNKNNNDHDSSDGTTIANVSTSTYVGSWHHVAYAKSSETGDQTLYLDGSAQGTVIRDNEILNPDDFYVGYQPYQAYDFDGIIDDIRISKSTRRTANFTPETTQLPVTGDTTQILPPPADKKGEIALGSTPVWKGSSGLTVTQESSGTYRLTFATAYSNNSDYFVIAQGMDHSASASSYIRVARSTAYVDIIVKNQANDNAVNTGAVGIQIINHN